MERARLSVNVNKYALLRNSRGHDLPNLLWSADLALAAGAHGITVHPRRDERHVHLADVLPLRDHLRANYPGIEYNIEFEAHPSLVDLVLEAMPDQATLVPVTRGEVTSDHGWDLPRQVAELTPVVRRLRDAGIRVSLFIDPDAGEVTLQAAADLGADRIELYTGPYAWAWGTDGQDAATRALWDTADRALAVGLELNAGHDLDRHNLVGVARMPGLLEVSIGHAQIARALAVGTHQSVSELLEALGW